MTSDQDFTILIGEGEAESRTRRGRRHTLGVLRFRICAKRCGLGCGKWGDRTGRHGS